MQVYYCEELCWMRKFGWVSRASHLAKPPPPLKSVCSPNAVGRNRGGRVRYKHWRARAVRYDSTIFLMA
jgi:hypothetical protein